MGLYWLVINVNLTVNISQLLTPEKILNKNPGIFSTDKNLTLKEPLYIYSL